MKILTYHSKVWFKVFNFNLNVMIFSAVCLCALFCLFFDCWLISCLLFGYPSRSFKIAFYPEDKFSIFEVKLT